MENKEKMEIKEMMTAEEVERLLEEKMEEMEKKHKREMQKIIVERQRKKVRSKIFGQMKNKPNREQQEAFIYSFLWENKNLFVEWLKKRETPKTEKQ